MSKLAVDRFLALVARSGLIEPARLAALEERWKRTASLADLDDAEKCGEQLVQAGALTPWQCHKLLDGRHRGFMLGNYQLLDHLGSGGMSNVYLAEHVLMQRRVAIKVLPENRVADASYLARFHFEGQVVASLDHPNIVRAYDLGSEAKIHYLVMEYVAGSDLENLVERAGPLPYHVAADYILQAAEGLEHAHRAGLIHRDIKPANLLVDRQGTVKVLDLGLARFRAEVRPAPDFARHEQVLGTAAYFAPEQASNSQNVDARADLYGLGCTFYYLLTGRPPFHGNSALELMQAHQQTPAPRVSALRGDAPLPLVTICQKMMEKSPGDRFQSAQEVAVELAHWLDSERQAGRLTEQTPGASPLAWGDTETHRHDTARIERLAKRRGGSSHVLAIDDRRDESGTRNSSAPALPPPPPTPPVVPPPRDTREVAPTVARAVVPNVVVPVTPSGTPHVAPTPFAPRVASRAARQRRSQSSFVWSALAFAALTIATILFALFALQS